MNDPFARVVIVGCSATKLTTATPVPALDLYRGWCFPALRFRAQGRAALRNSIWVLSGLHGLIGSETPLLPYDQPLTPARAAALRDSVRPAFAELLRNRPHEMLLLLAPSYLELLVAGLLADPPGAAYWIADPVHDWEQVDAVLTRWGWPSAPCPGGTP